ncbi:MAG: hypothetical protein ABIP95_02840 [Pelobium sp.]
MMWLANLLMPRDNAFAINPGKIICVFSDEITTKGLIKADLPLLKQKVLDEIEYNLLKYKA